MELQDLSFNLNRLSQKVNADKDSFLANKIKIYEGSDATTFATALTAAKTSLTTDYPNANSYDLLEVLLFVGATLKYVTLVIRLK